LPVPSCQFPGCPPKRVYARRSASRGPPVNHRPGFCVLRRDS
jgi:hypothetical protein